MASRRRQEQKVLCRRKQRLHLCLTRCSVSNRSRVVITATGRNGSMSLIYSKPRRSLLRDRVKLRSLQFSRQMTPQEQPSDPLGFVLAIGINKA